ncbi:MAG TPA: aldo/keto reductase [Propionicimonas sp.]|jgi:diketogulonate reductase-like aldo/keto reductase
MDSVALNNNLSMPTIGLGVYLVTDVRECERSVDLALRSGHRLIDTAAMYGNERAVGRGMRSSGIAREEIFLTTKIWPSQFGYERTTTAIAESLERLGTGYIDLLLLHQPVGDYLGSWRALEESVASGSVRSIGVSNFRVRELEELLAVATVPPTVNQVERHPYFQQKDLGTFLARHQIVPEAWFPIGHGSARLLGEAVFTELAGKYGKSPVQVVLRWHLQSGWVAIPKSTNPAHIEQNIDIFDFELTSEEVARIEAMDRDRPMFRVPRWLLGLVTRLVPIRDLP